MSKNDLIELLDICTEELGLTSPKEYCKAVNIPRSTFYFKIKKGEIKTYRISEHEFPLINY